MNIQWIEGQPTCLGKIQKANGFVQLIIHMVQNYSINNHWEVLIPLEERHHRK